MMRISQVLPAEKLLPEAQPERVEIARRKPDLSLEIVPVNLRKAWSGEADADVLLKPLDEVTVRTELKPARTITLTGQLVRPGVYTVAEGERLSSVLERAGGYSDRAFLRAAVFTRAALRKIEQEQLDNFVKAQEQRSEEHTSELQSLAYLVCRLLLEKKKKPGRCRITDGGEQGTYRCCHGTLIGDARV